MWWNSMSLLICCQFKDREYPPHERRDIPKCMKKGGNCHFLLFLTIVFVLVAVILDAAYHGKTDAIETHPIYQS